MVVTAVSNLRLVVWKKTDKWNWSWRYYDRRDEGWVKGVRVTTLEEYLPLIPYELLE